MNRFAWAPTLSTTCGVGLLCDQPLAQLLAGRFGPQQLLFGNNANESMFTVYGEISPTRPIPPAAYGGFVGALFGPASVAAVTDRYPCDANGKCACSMCLGWVHVCG
jgi:hypothetical protein